MLHVWHLFRYYLRVHGPLRFVPQSIRWFLDEGRNYSSDPFDADFGTDTELEVAPSEAGLPAHREGHAVIYVPSAPADLRGMIADLGWTEERLRAATFVDLGSGKGRAVLLAAEHPFRAIVGVELSESLHAISVRNLEAWSRVRGPDPRVRFVQGDAAEFAFPEGSLVIYLFHPFDAEILRLALGRLAASPTSGPRSVAILYRRPWVQPPIPREVFAEAGFSLISERLKDTRFFRTGWEIYSG